MLGRRSLGFASLVFVLLAVIPIGNWPRNRG